MDITEIEFNVNIEAHKDCENECHRLRASNAVLVETLENFTRNSVGYPNFLEYYHQGTECEGPESCAHCLAVNQARAAIESAKTV